VADIDAGEFDKSLLYYDKFYEACDSLCYRDCVALSRYFNISLRAVYAWRRHLNFPRHIDTALNVIGWVDAGKPMRQEQPSKVTFSMV
jgi:hypothetical protein